MGSVMIVGYHLQPGQGNFTIAGYQPQPGQCYLVELHLQARPAKPTSCFLHNPFPAKVTFVKYCLCSISTQNPRVIYTHLALLQT